MALLARMARDGRHDAFDRRDGIQPGVRTGLSGKTIQSVPFAPSQADYLVSSVVGLIFPPPLLSAAPLSRSSRAPSRRAHLSPARPTEVLRSSDPRVGARTAFAA